MKLVIEYDINLRDAEADLYTEIVQYSIHDWIRQGKVMWKMDENGDLCNPAKPLAVLKLASVEIIDEDSTN